MYCPQIALVWAKGVLKSEYFEISPTMGFYTCSALTTICLVFDHKCQLQ